MDLNSIMRYYYMTNSACFSILCCADPGGKASNFKGLMTTLQNFKITRTGSYDRSVATAGNEEIGQSEEVYTCPYTSP